MAKFLNTSGTTYHLEELIKKSSDRLILISPYLKLNERVKELLEDKNRLKIDIRIVYGKSDLQPEEINWLKGLDFVRTSFCKNLHAKCYMNENECIITSLNLYEFSQINNNEMGILIARDADNQLYSDAYEEAQRIIRISEEVRMSVDKVNEMSTTSENKEYGKITIAKLASQLGMKTPELSAKMIENGYLQEIAGELRLTQLGSEKGGEEKRGKFGIFTIWHKNFNF
ncbi:phospholipase D family protein [Moraxella osloensis]|nr:MULTISPECIES: phospholipase D family protein [Moraxella]MBL7667798.1 phospholipase D family protein [Moraxella osloensis]